MRRTQIYITDEQERRLSSRARDAGVPKAEIVRRILDTGLGIGGDTDQRRRALEATAGILSDAPPWQEWLTEVRSGRDAAERLAELER